MVRRSGQHIRGRHDRRADAVTPTMVASEGSRSRSAELLKCKFCPYTAPAWHRERVQLDEREARSERRSGVAFREGWRGLEAHVACIHPAEYRKIKQGLAQFDAEKRWALKP